jgi:hypothetical protein
MLICIPGHSDMTTTIAKLKIGQRFSFIPSDWYGPARLTEKTRREEIDFVGWGWQNKPVRKVKYDINFDANVVNPPGVIYGIAAETKVRLLSPKPQQSRKGHRAGYIV